MGNVIAQLQDSRRLTGPNLLADTPGAVIDCHVQGAGSGEFADAWRSRAREILDAVGWHDEEPLARPYDGGVTLFFSAPIDALYAATEVNEWAFAAAAADVGGGSPVSEQLSTVADELQRRIADERNPALLALRDAARARGVDFLSDDDQASVGTGTGSRTYDVTHLPHPDQIPWDQIHDVPRVLVTGTNGKTTTVRMLSEIIEAAGSRSGFTCTDGIYVGNQLVDAGDWSGPGGGRAVLRDPNVEYAILETARGGMLRRGLAVDRADGALVTNVAADHLGEWGVLTVEDVAAAKLIVAKAVRHGTPLVVNADDPHLTTVATGLGRPLTWTSADKGEWVRVNRAAETVAWILDDGWLVRIGGGSEERLIEAAAVPATLGGAAAYNVSNALGAAALAGALGLPDEAIRGGLTGFDSSPEQSPGRGNLFDVGGARVMVDFVHNAHGFDALARTARRLSQKRVGLMLGQAGDRDDDSIRAFVRAAWGLGPDRVAVKRMAGYERGRPPGEVAELIRDELANLGAPDNAVSMHDGEVEATAALLRWVEAGDFLLLSSQTAREEVLALVQAARNNA